MIRVRVQARNDFYAFDHGSWITRKFTLCQGVRYGSILDPTQRNVT